MRRDHDSHHRAIVAGMLLGASLGAGVISAEAAVFVIHPGEDENRVRFESKATLETVKGETDQVRGTVQVDLATLVDSIQVRVEVELASIDTGIQLRDRHMRENHLETDRYPLAVFHGGRILSASKTNLLTGETSTLRVAGTMELHGVTQAVEYDIDVTRGESGSLMISAAFELQLADHAISRPQFLVMKLAETVRLQIEVEARPAETAPPE